MSSIYTKETVTKLNGIQQELEVIFKAVEGTYPKHYDESGKSASSMPLGIVDFINLISQRRYTLKMTMTTSAGENAIMLVTVRTPLWVTASSRKQSCSSLRTGSKT